MNKIEDQINTYAELYIAIAKSSKDHETDKIIKRLANVFKMFYLRGLNAGMGNKISGPEQHRENCICSGEHEVRRNNTGVQNPEQKDHSC